MIKSMTGFGQAMHDDGNVQIIVEIRSLNSKFLDLSTRLPKAFSDREIELRNLISERLERGKITLSIEHQRVGDVKTRISYNKPLFKSYYEELKKLAEAVQAPGDEIFRIALESPEVIQNQLNAEVNESDWQSVRKCLLQAIQQCDDFRKQEGAALEKMMNQCCESIEQGLSKIEQMDPNRTERIRERIKGSVASFFGEEGFDMNRLEQEIIYYIEKLDINEEKVRLNTHLSYFREVLRDPASNGKKLMFISQEMGREINTIGSKANHAEIQKVVVGMKDELEKVKEQLNNVL